MRTIRRRAYLLWGLMRRRWRRRRTTVDDERRRWRLPWYSRTHSASGLTRGSLPCSMALAREQEVEDAGQQEHAERGGDHLHLLAEAIPLERGAGLPAAARSAPASRSGLVVLQPRTRRGDRRFFVAFGVHRLPSP